MHIQIDSPRAWADREHTGYAAAVARLFALALALPIAVCASEPRRISDALTANDSNTLVPGYNVDRHVIASGGGVSSSSRFAVAGTIGQLDADPLQPATGGAYALNGGFWSDAGRDRIFANGFEQ